MAEHDKISRNRGVLAFTAAAATAAIIGWRYKSNAIKNNELAQRTHKAPNGYVSVDRSGGGI